MRKAAVPFRVQAPAVDESQRPAELPAQMVARLAEAKARAAAARGAWMLAADTTVVLDGAALGKPADPRAAVCMLEHLRDRTHVVLTGVCVLPPQGPPGLAVVQTQVRMRHYSRSEIDAYVASGAPLDKAGAYGIQDRALHPVEAILGCYPNVVGLPLCAVAQLLRAAGFDALPSGPVPCPHAVTWTAPPGG